MTTAPIIRAESLVKTYTLGASSIRALDGVSMDVAAGEMVAIMGKSGSGKSTLINILGCLDRPDSGRCFLGGTDISGLSSDERAVVRSSRFGFVFQSFNLLPRLTALENVELPLLYAGLRGGRDRAEQALRDVGLAARANHRPIQLSGGERQRVAIARALVCNPDVIFADEPTGNLDTRTGEEIMTIFNELNRRGRTFLIVSHSSEVASHCCRQIHLLDGRIDENGFTGVAEGKDQRPGRSQR